MKVNGIEGISEEELNQLIQQGAKFVVFEYTISILIMTFKRSSDVYFIRPGQHGALKGIGFTLISFFFGWWGIPWGPIYTIGSIFNNLSGGKNVTDHFLAGDGTA